ncbi:PREDICTED: uncharacterized protein LOC109178152 [Ipomoea nil]|uniref:uncharacterized protein LOC109178152 n=1 Tax=Ipomoea nil TaxID=35883 RepID=UPI0009008783|nr:PREDICTED: uncharacterized protein LOC109178152 [Ipomoea nil]XP_019183263.1 PREDICTED: uncharacterized protein LOC109178152 [Ipomoea nil]
MSFRKGGSGWTSFRKEELQEEEIWGVFGGGEADDESSPSSTTRRRISTAAKMIPRSNNREPKMAHQQHSSAPVNIPDWSKIYGAAAAAGDGFLRSSWESDGDEDDVNGGEMMPPHEWLARKYARSQISSFSVCEGVGRTLKGRDISRVRNAVLTRTGFLE